MIDHFICYPFPQVLSAILLVGNVSFSAPKVMDEVEVEVEGRQELGSVASLLGVPAETLTQGLTSRTHTVRGQPVKSISDANLVSKKRTILSYGPLLRNGLKYLT